MVRSLTVAGTVGVGVGVVTVTVAPPFTLSLVAVMVAVPEATPLPNPLASTVATPLLLLAHVTVRPYRTLPLEPFTVAVNCCFCPTVKDSSGNVLSGRTVTWASNNNGVATVDANGLGSGVASGTATITATSESVN